MSRTIFNHEAVRHFAKSRELCDKLAELLEVQADGGDSPGAFVQGQFQQWAADELEKSMARLAALRRGLLAREFAQQAQGDGE